MENNLPFETILDQCIAMLRDGQSMNACLARYPEQAEELRPLLMIAAELTSFEIPDARLEAVISGKDRMLAKMHTLREPAGQPAVSKSWIARYTRQIRSIVSGKERYNMRFGWRLLISTLLVTFLCGFAIINVSANSLPGDLLYGVKVGWENTRLGLTQDTVAKDALRAHYNIERQNELIKMIKDHREGAVTFLGKLDEIEAQEIVVDHIQLSINEGTVVDGEPDGGEVVEITVNVTKDGVPLTVNLRVVDQNMDDDPDSMGWTEDEDPTDWESGEWVTPIPYWKTVKPTEWRTLVPTEYQTLVPEEFLSTAVPPILTALPAPEEDEAYWREFYQDWLENPPAPSEYEELPGWVETVMVPPNFPEDFEFPEIPDFEMPDIGELPDEFPDFPFP